MKSNTSNLLYNPGNMRKYLNPKLGYVFIVLIVLWFHLAPLFFSVIEIDYIYLYFWGAIISCTILMFSLMFFKLSALDVFRDQFTLWAIVLSCFLPIFFGGERLVYKAILIGLGIFLAIYVIVNRKNIKLTNLKLVFIGIGWSVVAVFILALIIVLWGQPNTKPFPSNLLTIIFNAFINQLSFTSVPEETCFRGLIFSFLIMNGFRDDKAFVIQALLFWGLHFGDINSNPISFFVLIPLSTLFMTLIIRKYRMLHLSIMMHASINTFTTVLASLMYRILF